MLGIANLKFYLMYDQMNPTKTSFQEKIYPSYEMIIFRHIRSIANEFLK